MASLRGRIWNCGQGACGGRLTGPYHARKNATSRLSLVVPGANVVDAREPRRRWAIARRSDTEALAVELTHTLPQRLVQREIRVESGDGCARAAATLAGHELATFARLLTLLHMGAFR